MQNTSDEIRETRYELIDTHAHLAFDPLFGDVEAVLKRSRDAGISKCITVGTNTAENERTIQLAERYDNLYAAVGIHPHYAKETTDDDFALLEQLARSEKVVAVGETGLDYHYNFSKHQAQKELFKKHLALAAELNLPVIIHSRDAFDDTIDMLEQHGGGIEKTVFHCFTGTAEQAKAALDKGYMISFTGVVTFKHADDVRQAAKVVPVEKMMLETDCPYMSPAPMRKQKTNEPALLVHTAKFIAELKNISVKELCEKTTANAGKFYNLG